MDRLCALGDGRGSVARTELEATYDASVKHQYDARIAKASCMQEAKARHGQT